MSGRDGQGFVWITIANDGIPYQEEDLFSDGRVGITSVKERLSIRYPKSFFWYDRKGSFQTVCNLLIPEETVLEMGEKYEDFDSGR